MKREDQSKKRNVYILTDGYRSASREVLLGRRRDEQEGRARAYNDSKMDS